MTEAEKFAYKTALIQAINAAQFAATMAKLLGMEKDQEILDETANGPGGILTRIYKEGVGNESDAKD